MTRAPLCAECSGVLRESDGVEVCGRCGYRPTSPEEEEKEAFKAKLRSLSFGTVPGGYKDSGS